MNGEAERHEAEEAVAEICAELPVPAALAVLTEIQARILAENGITSDSDAFLDFLKLYIDMLPKRMNALRREFAGQAN